MQQTIKSQEGSITSFRITNLLQFYGQTMQKTIGPGALLSKTLLACVSDLPQTSDMILILVHIASQTLRNKCSLTRLKRKDEVSCGFCTYVSSSPQVTPNQHETRNNDDDVRSPQTPTSHHLSHYVMPLKFCAKFWRCMMPHFSTTMNLQYQHLLKNPLQ